MGFPLGDQVILDYRGILYTNTLTP